MTLFERFEAYSLRKQIFVLLFISLVLLYLTDPLNLTFGYLEAEEGSTYLLYARTAGLWRALIAPHQGYYSLVPNVTMLLPARFLPLITAAWIGEWTAILFRLWTIYFVCTCEAIKTARSRLSITVLLSLLPCTQNIPGCIHTQFFLGAITAILLISDPEKRIVSRCAALVIGGLSSPASCMFVPFFLYRAWKRRSAAAIAQAAILTVCTAIQLPIIRVATQYTDRGVISFSKPWVYFDALVNHILVLPFFTRVPYHVLAGQLETHAGWPWLVFAVIGLVLLAALFGIVWPAGYDARKILLIGWYGAVAIIITATGGDTIIGGGERYYVAVNTCVVIALVLAMEFYRNSQQRSRYTLTCVLLAAVAVSGVVEIAAFFKRQQIPLHWPQQVAAWQQDSSATFRNGPWFWDHPFHLPPRPTSFDLPFYTYDSVTRGALLKQLPAAWYQAYDETLQPTSLPHSIDLLKR